MTAAGLTSQDPRSLTKAELMTYAGRLGIRGRSRMQKSELARAIAKAL